MLKFMKICENQLNNLKKIFFILNILRSSVSIDKEQNLWVDYHKEWYW